MDRGELIDAAIFSVGPKDLGTGVNNAYPVRVLPAVKCTEEQLKNAIISYAVDCMTKDVIVLVDVSLSGTGEKGFLFTADRFYSDDSEFLDGRLHPNVSMPIRYDELERVELDRDHDSHIVLHYTNGRVIRTYTGIYTCFFAAVFEAILKTVGPRKAQQDQYVPVMQEDKAVWISEEMTPETAEEIKSGETGGEPETAEEIKSEETGGEPETAEEIKSEEMGGEPETAEETESEETTPEDAEILEPLPAEKSEEAVPEKDGGEQILKPEPKEAPEETAQLLESEKPEEVPEETTPETPEKPAGSIESEKPEAPEKPEESIEGEKLEAVKPRQETVIGEDAKRAYQRGIELYNAGDAEASIKEFIKAAGAGHVIAQYKCGMMYDYGWGAVPDKAEALKWYLKAAENGHEEAPYICGMMYYDGEGTKQDQAQAKYWFEKAASQGNEDAKIWLEINNLANS